LVHNILFVILIALLVLILLALRWWRRWNPLGFLPPWPLAKRRGDDRFTQENITDTFISAIPTLTKEMNLEVATSNQTEVFERKDGRTFFGFDVGTNLVSIRVPVTYRYHIRLYDDSWKLEIEASTLRVRSPEIEASLPPAIHTDQLEQHSVRGWCRLPPTSLLEQLNRDLTPTLSHFAIHPRQVELIRETCRAGVAQFIRQWLEAEGRWSQDGFTAIVVQFTGEPTPPSQPVLHLDFQHQNNTQAAL